MGSLKEKHAAKIQTLTSDLWRHQFCQALAIVVPRWTTFTDVSAKAAFVHGNIEINHSCVASCHGYSWDTPPRSSVGRARQLLSCNGLTHSCCGVCHEQPRQPLKPAKHCDQFLQPSNIPLILQSFSRIQIFIALCTGKQKKNISSCSII